MWLTFLVYLAFFVSCRGSCQTSGISLRIVVLDGRTLNPGDLSWDEIARCGQLQVYDRTPENEIVGRLVGAQVAITNKTPLSASTIDQLPELKLITVTATGYNVVDVVHAKAKEVSVCNVPAYSTASVAQHVFALLLGYLHVPESHHAAVSNGQWQREKDFSFSLKPLVELSGKTFGIVGLGSIGRATARVADALGMRVVAHSRTQTDPLPFRGFEWVSREDVFRQSDVVSLHCPLTAENAGFVQANLLKLMKPSAILINTARGGLIDESDLAEALNQGVLQAALLDVVSNEPINEDNPLLSAPRCMITPHVAWATLEARKRAMAVTTSNIIAFQNGTPQNVVS